MHEMVRPKTAQTRTMTMVLEGEIGAAEMTEVGEMLLRLSLQGVTRVVVDLHDVSHFDYRGVRPLMRRADAFRELGGDIKLAGLSPYLHAIFRSAGANEAFDFFASTDDALGSFERGVFTRAG